MPKAQQAAYLARLVPAAGADRKRTHHLAARDSMMQGAVRSVSTSKGAGDWSIGDIASCLPGVFLGQLGRDLVANPVDECVALVDRAELDPRTAVNLVEPCFGGFA